VNRPIEHPKPPKVTVAEPVYPHRWFSLPTSAMTHAGFRAWAMSDDYPDFGRVSFLGSEIFIDMSGERIDTHVVVKTEINGVLGPWVRKAKLGRYFSDGALISNEAAIVSNIPDAIFVSRQSFASGRVTLTPRPTGEGFGELAGTPDLVVEILSDSSVRKDTVQLRRYYFLAGIPEYWLIDARGDDLRFQILARGADDYTEVPAGRGGWLPSAVFGRRFRLRRELDEFGLWLFTLDMRR
jgi:Uma2 family endonuclease